MYALIRRGAWPVPMRTLEQLRNLVSYALGAGSANLPLEQSGELKLLDHLAALWAGRDDVVVADVGANDGRYAVAAPLWGRCTPKPPTSPQPMQH
jgi:hypothetical protein